MASCHRWCVVQEQEGFICESNATNAQDICLGIEQSICHFEMCPAEILENVLTYIGKSKSYLWFHRDHSTIEISHHSNIWLYSFQLFSFVTTHELLQSTYTFQQDLLLTLTGMNLALVEKLLQHSQLCWLLEGIWSNGHRALMAVHHSTEEIHPVFPRVMRNGKYHWWDCVWMVSHCNRNSRSNTASCCNLADFCHFMLNVV